MCGIVAIINSKAEPVSADVVQRMLAPIVHRGPDDSGVVIEGPVGLGFRRLSILDLSAHGHQPMQSDEGQLTLIFNGEIYNYLELREQLMPRAIDSIPPAIPKFCCMRMRNGAPAALSASTACGLF